MSHIPVMLNEVLTALDPKDGCVYVDGTFGAGGYTRAILDRAKCDVIAIDRDERAIATATQMSASYDGRLKPFHGSFSTLSAAMTKYDVSQIDGIVLDIGVSSMQIDQAERGFSFQKDGPLDMRMDTSAGITAAEFVNEAEEEEIANIIWKYGEERASRKIAKHIVANRPFSTTLQLADMIADLIPSYKSKTHAATKTFQAIRIHINNELGELETVLEATENALKSGGRLGVVTFHSLEDRIVKSFLTERAQAPSFSRHMPMNDGVVPLTFELGARRAVKVSEAEASENPRSRSAKLRWAIRTDAQRNTGGAV